jgi:hydrogenase maturation protease
MSEAPRERRLLIGIGNPERGDDAAGRAVARRLLAGEHRGLDVRECAGEAATLMEAWAGYEEVVLVDACRGGGAPGTVHRIGPGEAAGFATFRHASSHSFGVAAAIGLAQALGTLPPRLVVYAIAASDSREGAGMSSEVERAVEEVVALLRRDVET